MASGDPLVEGKSGSGASLTGLLGLTNVQDYGATGDGLTDDTSAINSAVAALSAHTTLYFPPGVYKISSTITVQQSGISLIGTGPEATVIKRMSGFTTGNLIEFTGTIADNAISNMKLDSTSRVTSGAQLYLNDTQRLRGEFVYITNGHIGVQLEDYSTANFTQSYFQVGGLNSGTNADAIIKLTCDGSRDNQSNALRLTDCNIDAEDGGHADYAMYVEGVDGMWVENCHFGGSDAGIKFLPIHNGANDSFVGGVLITSSWFDYAYGGAHIEFAGYSEKAYLKVFIANCIFDAPSGGRGIYFNCSGAPSAPVGYVSQVGIHGCEFSDMQYEAIKINGANGRIFIEGNQFYGASAAGTSSYNTIYVAAGQEGFHINNNHFSSGGNYLNNTKPNYHVYVADGSSNYYSIMNNVMLFAVQDVGYYDGGTGAVKRVADNLTD